MDDTPKIDLKITQPPETLRDIVQEKLRNAILEGHFKPGDRLVERPLCDQLGVSRTVVRETIRYLEAEGLVTNQPNKGPIVTRMTADEARQIYEIRKMLESSAAMACARAPSPELRLRLNAALHTLKSAYTARSPSVLLAATSNFYQVIFDHAGHSVAWQVAKRLNARISWLRRMTLSSSNRHKSGFDHMTRIHDAILTGDPAEVEQVVTTHLTEAAEIATRLLEEAAAKENTAD